MSVLGPRLAAVGLRPRQECVQNEIGSVLHSRAAIESSGERGSMARHRYQTGCVFKRGKNPVWVGRFRTDEIDPSGQVTRVLKSVVLGSVKELPTKALAKRRLELELAKINSPAYRPGRTSTLEDFAERWKREVLSKRKPSTVHAAESHLKIQILPILGKMKLSEIGVETQQSFVTRLSGTVSRKSLLNVLGTLSSILTTAGNWNYVCERVSFGKLALPEREVHQEARSFTEAQARAIVAHAKEPYCVMFAIAAMTGLRAGEILALQAGDLDFDNRLLSVRRSVWRGKVQTPKTSNSQAVLPLPDALVRIVKPHVEKLSTPWLFLNRRGRFFIAENVVRQALTPVLDKLKIPRAGFHAFRHLHTSLLLSSGAAPQVAQKQLRHSDARITLGVYAHVIGDEHRNAVEKVAGILFPNVPNLKPATEIIQ